MSLAITHSTVATLPDEAGAEINKAEWNAAHVIADLSAASRLLGSDESGATVKEIPLGTGLSFVAGSLTGFSGAYAALSGLPSLFSGAYADLSGKPTLGTFADQNFATPPAIGGTTPAAVSGTTITATELFTQAAEDSITAFAGGGKASATVLSATKNLHRVSVCATQNDSILMPPALVGQAHYVRNDGAKAMQVFGQGTDTINGVATATGISHGFGAGVWYACTTAGAWTASPVDTATLSVALRGSAAFAPYLNLGVAAAGMVSVQRIDALNSYVSFGFDGTNASVRMATSGKIGFSNSATNANTTIDVSLFRDGAGQLALRDANNAQEFRVYAGNGGFLSNVKSVTESLTIAAAATTVGATSIPAGAILLGVSVRVTTVIPTAATFTYATTVGGTALNTAAVSTAANSTNPGTAAGASYRAAATTVTITPNLTPGAATGVVRLQYYYLQVTPPTS